MRNWKRVLGVASAAAMAATMMMPASVFAADDIGRRTGGNKKWQELKAD